MDDKYSMTLTVTQYIQRLSKELNIAGSTGLFGNELELIALVRNCQFLYDKNLPDFKNIKKKNEAWEAIAAVFGVTVGEVQARWKSMRDVFGKLKNKNEGHNTGTRTIACPYYDDMKFLEPYIVARRTRVLGINSTIERMNSDDEESFNKDSHVAFDDLQRFIERVKETPLLYHHNYTGASYAKQKVDIWVEISKTFGIPVQECLTRWKSLRERYSRERRNQQLKGNVRKWEFFDDLSFLDEHVKSRSHSRKLTRVVPTNPSAADQNICYVVTSPNSSESVTIDSSTFLNEMSLSAKKEVSIEDVEFFDVSSDITSSPAPLFNEETNLPENNLLETSTSSHNDSMNKSTPDEDDLFGQSIAAELKKMPCPKQKIKLKAEIYRLIYEHTCD